jgi:hypothetical protein
MKFSDLIIICWLSLFACQLTSLSLLDEFLNPSQPKGAQVLVCEFSGAVRPPRSWSYWRNASCSPGVMSSQRLAICPRIRPRELWR